MNTGTGAGRLPRDHGAGRTASPRS